MALPIVNQHWHHTSFHSPEVLHTVQQSAPNHDGVARKGKEVLWQVAKEKRRLTRKRISKNTADTIKMHQQQQVLVPQKKKKGMLLTKNC